MLFNTSSIGRIVGLPRQSAHEFEARLVGVGTLAQLPVEEDKIIQEPQRVEGIAGSIEFDAPSLAGQGNLEGGLVQRKEIREVAPEAFGGIEDRQGISQGNLKEIVTMFSIGTWQAEFVEGCGEPDKSVEGFVRDEFPPQLIPL
jgi:hypothetical protein